MASVPPPPPPPPPPPSSGTGESQYSEIDQGFKDSINDRMRKLEEAHHLESELQAWETLVAFNLHGKTIQTKNLPNSVVEGLSIIVEATDSMQTEDTLYMRPGQRAQTIQNTVTDRALKRMKYCADQIEQLDQSADKSDDIPKDLNLYMGCFYEKLQDLRNYHGRQQPNTAATNKLADGYSLETTIQSWIKELDESAFTAEEVYGKYLDLQDLYESMIVKSNDVLYGDFLEKLVKQRPLFSEADKLKSRKHYQKWLNDWESYLKGFLLKTIPAIDLSSIVQPTLKDFEETWGQTGGAPPQWKAIAAEAPLAKGSSDTGRSVMDLEPYQTAEELAKKVSPEILKAELSRLGLKCGGTPKDRAERLFLLKSQKLDELPKKLFTKTEIRRVDLAKQEAIIQALLDRLHPTLEATWRRTERRQTQTLRERELELEQELYGNAEWESQKKKLTNEGSDDEDAVVYNPKNLPLDWSGNPIPYWQFKLYGLNHYYYCELCGGESYRGRRAFESHFAESRHSSSLRALGIPNTRHFHGVTKLQDVQDLWKKLQEKFQNNQEVQQEEYEDSQGNVLSRKTYEDLARQGLL